MKESSDHSVEFKNIRKEFPGVIALNDVSFTIKKGEVHALIGENGAGKSTIMKILAGIYVPDHGEIYLNGERSILNTPRDALQKGISMIHQELNLIPEMTVEQNLFVGREECYRFGVIKKKKLINSAYGLFKEMGLNINPKAKISSLSVAEMQMVEIAKATSYDADVIIMDEPTSAITDREVVILFKIIRNLKAKGKSIIYISHKLDEIFQIADRITVLRDGCLIDTRPIGEMNKPLLISLMVGRDLKEMYVKEESKIGDTALEVKGLTLKGKYSDISFRVRKGEILGIAGLMGAGRTEVAETIFGLRKPDKGEFIIYGKNKKIDTPKSAMKNSIAFITEDRKLFGLNLVASTKNNITLAYLKDYTFAGQVLNFRKENEVAEAQIEALSIKTPSRDTPVESLSGGNQQKVVLAKWLLGNPDIIVMDEPTRGIDVGAKAEIYKIMTELAKKGKAIIMISSEMPELLGMSDRILVLYNGKIMGEFTREEFDQERLMFCATGHCKGEIAG